MKLPIEHVKNLSLNSASEQYLADDVGLGAERARRVVDHRPLVSWDALRRLEGFTDALVSALRDNGAQLGEPTQVGTTRSEREPRDTLNEAAHADPEDEGVPADTRVGPTHRVS